MQDIDYGNITKLIEECKESTDINERIQLLHMINSILPESQKLKIPSLITNDYVSYALYSIEEKLVLV